MTPARQPVDLLLRPWAEADAPALREAIDEDVDHLRPRLSWTLDEPASPERTRARLAGWAEAFRTGEGLRFAITPADRPWHILGGANLNTRLGPDDRDVGYWVRASATRQGIARAAVSRLVVHAFEEMAVSRLVAQCDVGNAASAEFATALGFTAIGEAVTRWPDGSPRAVLRFEMRREAYETEHGAALRRRAERVRLVTDPGAP